MKFIDELKEKTKTQKVKLYFDMDGTCAEYNVGEKNDILTNKKGFYLTKRPLKYILQKMKDFSKMKNVEICVASNCHFKEQKNDKIEWLNKYLPFIKMENINIIVLNEITFKKEEKDFLKGRLIKKTLKDDEHAYLIEDDHDIIKATNSLNFKNLTACHISTIID